MEVINSGSSIRRVARSMLGRRPKAQWRLVNSLGVIGWALLATAASAQSQPASTDTDLEASSDEPSATTGQLDEVVVTVDRRRKDLQKYSGTASAFTEQKLQQVGIVGVAGLASVVPGLQIGVQEGNTEIYIRGIGSDNNTEVGDMGVALHLDGVYLPRPRGVGAMFYDIERVEVNSGPQGTLRGRNAQGGSINIVTNKPKLGEFGANAEATMGTFATRRYQGMVNIPIGDRLALRVAGYSSFHDPYWQNGGPLYDLRAAESDDTYAFRGQVKWQPIDPLSIVVGYDIVHERGTGSLGAGFNALLTNRDDNGTPDNLLDDVPAAISPQTVKNPRRVYQLGAQPNLDMEHQGARIDANLDLGPVQVEALASYRDLVFKQVNGASAGVIYPGFDYVQRARDGLDYWGTAYWDTRSQSTITELRFGSPDTARLRWTAGGFYMYEKQQVVLYITSDPIYGYGGAEYNMPDVYEHSVAGYADATFDVRNDFRVLGGIRVTNEGKGRRNGLAMQRGGVPNNASRFGTEGFRPAYRDRPTFSLPLNSTAEQRVNLFLDGVGSFGARDTFPEDICNDPPAAAPGQEQQPRLFTDPTTGTLRCKAGVDNALVTDRKSVV